MDEDIDGLIWNLRVAMTLERLDEARSLMKRLSSLMELPGVNRSNRFHIALDSATLSRFTGDLAAARRYGVDMQASSANTTSDVFCLEWNGLRQTALEGRSGAASHAAHALLDAAARPDVGRARSALAVAEYASALAESGLIRRAISLYDAEAEWLMEQGGYGAWVALHMYLKGLLLIDCARACEEKHVGNLAHEAMGAMKARVYWNAAEQALAQAAAELSSTDDIGMLNRSIAAVRLVIPGANASADQVISAMEELTLGYGAHHIVDTFVLSACETARIHSAQGNYDAAVASLLSARSMMPLSGYKTLKSKIDFHESLVYAQQGRTRHALLAYQRYAQRTLSRTMGLDAGFRDESLDVKSRKLLGSTERRYKLGQAPRDQTARPDAVGAQPDAADAASLTPREREILGLVAQGMTNKQIAELLAMSANTVRNHMTAILKRSGLATRQQAAELWRQRTGPAT